LSLCSYAELHYIPETYEVCLKFVGK
jgi:hypothetical protein